MPQCSDASALSGEGGTLVGENQGPEAKRTIYRVWRCLKGSRRNDNHWWISWIFGFVRDFERATSAPHPPPFFLLPLLNLDFDTGHCLYHYGFCWHCYFRRSFSSFCSQQHF